MNRHLLSYLLLTIKDNDIFSSVCKFPIIFKIGVAFSNNVLVFEWSWNIFPHNIVEYLLTFECWFIFYTNMLKEMFLHVICILVP